MSFGPRGRPLDAAQSTDVYFSRGPCNALGYSLFSRLILRQRGQRLQLPPPSSTAFTLFTGLRENAGRRESRECHRVSMFKGNAGKTVPSFSTCNRRRWSRESLNFNTEHSLCRSITLGNPFTPCRYFRYSSHFKVSSKHYCTLRSFLPSLAFISDFSDAFLPGLRPLLPPSFRSPRDPSCNENK